MSTTATTQTRVVAERGPYDTGSPESWVRDQLTVAEPGISTTPSMVAEARSRLAAHEFVIADAIDRGSEYGKRARQMLVESLRGANPEPGYHEHAARQRLDEVRNGLRDAELRSLVTGGGTTLAATSGASVVVPPAILLEQWVRYRSPVRAVADQCTPEQLPSYGMKVSIPNVTTAPSEAVQTEGGTVSDTDPVMGLLTDDVQPFNGQIQVSQQLLDRAGPGIRGDQLLFAQLKEMLDAQIDVHVIAQILAGAQSVTNSSTFTIATASGVGGFLGDLKAAKSLTRNAAGVRINSTHGFAVGDFTDFVAAYADAQGRPIFSPALDDNRLPIRSTGDQDGEAYTGYIVAGLALMCDDNIPASGSDIQVIVARPDTVSLFEGVPIPYCYPPSIAGSLLAILGLRSYGAAIPRYPSGAAVISGSAYTATTFA